MKARNAAARFPALQRSGCRMLGVALQKPTLAQNAHWHHLNAWELMVAHDSVAQCTDSRVNMFTPGLFKKVPYPD